MLDELKTLGLNVPRSAAAELLRERVATLADELRVTERTARGYVTSDMIRELARTLAFSIADEHPGADVLDLPRDASVPWTRVGRLFTALAEAGRVRLANDDPEGAENSLHLISTYGLLTHDTQSAERHTPQVEGVACPSAVLTRAARFLEATVDMLRDGARMPSDACPSAAQAVATQMTYDATALRSYLPSGGSHG